MTDAERRLEERAFAPILHTSRGYKLLLAVLIAVLAWGAFAYSQQVQHGLYVTGMRDRIFWGLYIALFVFFVGASMGGTFVSAVLRLTHAQWRAPITRGAEYMTVSALVSAGFIITVNMSQILRMHHVVLFGRWESQLVWDLYGLSTYLVGSMIYLYLAIIPDLALARDRLGAVVSLPRRLFFFLFSAGWIGEARQVRTLGMALAVMTVLIIPVAVMMHTVTSWIFGMMLRDPWDSPMFGIYFVGGAIYSGTGLIIILMAIMRRAYRLEEYLTLGHFRNLGYLLAAAAAVMIFFQVSDFVTAGYKLEGDAPFHLHQMVHGQLASAFWVYLWGGLILPFVMVMVPFTRNIAGIVVAGIAANVGMFLERYFIVVGGLRVPLNPYEPATYAPSWVEWSLMAAVFALFILLIALMLKLAPGISISEMRESGEVEAAEGEGAVPDASAAGRQEA